MHTMNAEKSIEHAIQFLSNDYHFDGPGSKAEAKEISLKLKKYAHEQSWVLLNCKRADLKAAVNSAEAMYKYLTNEVMANAIKAYPFQYIVINPETKNNPFSFAGSFVDSYAAAVKMDNEG